MTSSNRTDITLSADRRHVTIGGRMIAVADIEAAAHQDDPVWLYYHRGLAAPPQDDETRQLAAAYRDMWAELTRAITAAEEADRRARVRACRQHVAVESHDYGFCGPVSREENPAAHGNITRVERCRCGAERCININGRHIEQGEWD